MKIAFFEIEDWEKKYLIEKLKNYELIFSKDVLNKKTLKLAESADIISVFIYSNVSRDILLKLKKVKAISTRSTGYDHIDIKECKKRKIKVLNVPFYGENTVAEHTFALILSLSRKIHKSYERTIRGDFSLEGLRGFDLKNKTIGIIGLGHIGKHVARIANGFEMNILAYDIIRDKKLAKKLNIVYTSLNDLLKNSDIITLHCPYNKPTHHIINSKNIKKIKKTGIIINTARGANIETEALVKALSRKEIAGAALDVLEEESIIKEEIQLLSKVFSKQNLQKVLENHLLLTFDNVIITPHNAFNSKEALQRIIDVTIENILCFNNKKDKNIVK